MAVGESEVQLNLESLPGLQFESLEGAGGIGGAISSAVGSKEKSYSDEEESFGASDREKLLSEEKKKGRASSSWFACLSLEYYQDYFDVTTSEVGYRILAGLSPLPFNLAASIDSSPDLYGPFWLCMTLLLTTAISGNVTKFFTGSTAWEFRFNQVVVLAIVIYGYTWLVPVLLWMVLVWRKTDERYSLLQLLSIYGYSMAVFIPLTLLWLININILRWVLLAVAVLLSGTVLVRALWRPLKNESVRLAVVTLILLFLLHSAVAIGFKFYYFSSVFPAIPPTTHPTMATNLTSPPSLSPSPSHLTNLTVT